MNLNTQKTPNEDIEKPEPLKHELSVYWSRRINDEHRIVYKQQDDTILIAQLLNCSTALPLMFIRRLQMKLRCNLSDRFDVRLHGLVMLFSALLFFTGA
jgi:hypothetical protein